MAALVPMEQAATPGATAPTPRLARTPSLAPATTGVPVGSSQAAASGLSCATTSVVACRLGSWSRRSPARSSAPGSQSRAASPYSPVAEAVDSSTASSPVSRNSR